MADTNDIRDTMCLYAALRRGVAECAKHRKSPGPISSIIDRYRSVWTSSSPFQLGTTDVLDKSIASITDSPAEHDEPAIRYYSFAQPDKAGPWDPVRRAATLPFFRRLNYVKQLSTTNIALNLEATHNRLSHLLGTVDMCGALLQSCCNSAPVEALPTGAEATAVLLHALFHDAYHGPFGHSLDRIGDLILQDKSERRIDKALLQDEVAKARKDKRGEVYDVIAAVAKEVHGVGTSKWALRIVKSSVLSQTSADLADELLRILALLVRPSALAEELPEKYWLCELMDGAVDADRLDYILRDVRHLHQRADVTQEDVQALIKGAAVSKADISRRDVITDTTDSTIEATKKRVHRLHWDVKHKALVGDILKLRSDLYSRVYEAPEKRAFDEMLAHALVWVIREASKGVDAKSWLPERTYRSIVQITDDELFHFLYEAGTTSQSAIATALIHDLAVGRAFEEVWRLSIPFGELAKAKVWAVLLAAKWDHSLRKEIEKSGVHTFLLRREPDWDTTYRCLVAAMPSAAEIVDKPEQYTARLFGLVYLLNSLLGHSFKGRIALERMLWSRLLDGDGDVDLAENIHTTVFGIYEHAEWPCVERDESTEKWRARAREMPLIFLSIPWVPSLPVRFPERRMDELSQLSGSELDKEVEALEQLMDLQDPHLVTWDPENEPVFHRKGKPVEQRRDIARRKSDEYFPIAVYLPPALAGPKVRSLVDRLLLKLIFSAAWYAPEKAERAGLEWWKTEIPPDLLNQWSKVAALQV